MDVLSPRRPEHLPDYSEMCLQALVAHGLSEKISLGGAFGLLHYLDYRVTHDVDAWWTDTATEADRRQALQVLKDVLSQAGEVKLRVWGDVSSVELARGGKTVFSFQIARRAAQLEPTRPAPWIQVPLDSLADLVASKMVALIERGAPRDFRDIYAVCQADLLTPRDCWALWRRRQIAADSSTDVDRAALAIQTHLTRIAQHRRLEQIGDPTQRQQAQAVRDWYAGEFLDAAK
jgi:predicted nucleotidyltransferase component of viral defense system